LYNILESLTEELRMKIQPERNNSGSDLKFLGFFGHDTNIQNFYKLFIQDKEKLMSNKHRIPEFAATLSWELFEIESSKSSADDQKSARNVRNGL